MANVWNAQMGRWEDPDTGNVLIGGQGNPDGTWSGGTWTNPQGGQYVNNQWQQTAPIGSPQTAQYNAQQNVYGAQQNQINAGQGVYQAQQANIPNQAAQIQAERGVNSAQGNVLAAQAGTFGPQQAVIDAKGNVINAQSGYTQAQQGFIGQQQQANAAQQADQNAIIAARGNTQDQINVARYQQEQADLSGRYQAAGVSQPIRVFNNNQTGPLAPGVIGDVRTQEQQVSQEAQDRQTARSSQLQSAQLGVQMQGTNVDVANQAQARAGQALDQAQLGVSQAQNQKGYADIAASNAGLNVQTGNLGITQAQINAAQAGNATQQAQLNYSLANQPPYAGAQPLIDPQTGYVTGWGSPAEAYQSKQVYQNNMQKQANVAQLQQSGLLGGLSQGELLSMLGNGVLGPREVTDELERRYNAGQSGGLNHQAALLLIQNYQEQHGGSSSGADPNAPDPFDSPAEAAAKAARRAAAGGASPTTSPATLPGTVTIGSPEYQRAMQALQANMAAAGGW